MKGLSRLRLCGMAALAALVSMGGCGESASRRDTRTSGGGVAQGARVGSDAGRGTTLAGKGGASGGFGVGARAGRSAEGGQGNSGADAGRGGAGDGGGEAGSRDASAPNGGAPEAGASSSGGADGCRIAAGTLDVDIPTVTISGAITVNGMPPPSTATGVVRLTAGDDRADIASVQAGTYSATVVPGTYELGYNLNTGLDAAIPLGRTVTIDETSTLDVDIPMATVFGNLTVDGQPLAPGSSYAYFTFRSSNGLEAAWGTIESGSYSVELPAGTYDVLYSSDQGGGEIPQNQSATIFRGLTIEEDQRLDIDIPMVTLSGQLTAAVLPAGASSLYVTTDDGDFALLADIHDGIYSARLTPGAYDVRVGELVGPGFRNEDLGEPLAQVALDDSKTLDLDVPAVTITGAVTLNGARASFGYDAGLYLLGTSNRYVQIPHLDIPGYTAKIVPGTYDIVYYGAGTVDTSRGYSSNPDDGIPDNPSVVVRSGVEISTSQTLDIDVPMVVITGKIGVNGGPAEPGREGILYFVTAGGDPFIAETTAATSYRVELVPGTYSVFYLRSGDTMVNGQFATVLSNIQLDRDGTVDLELTMKHLSGSVTVNGAVPPSGVAYLWLMGTDYADLEWGSGIQPTYDTEVIPETYDIRYADWSYGAGLPFNQFAKIGCIRIE